MLALLLSASLVGSFGCGSAPHPEKLFLNAFLERLPPRARIASEHAIPRFCFSGIRLEIDWGAVQPRADRWQWSTIDSITAWADRNQIAIVGLLTYTPAWARPAGTKSHHRPIVDGSHSKGDQAFAHFAAEAARRYREKIEKWEVWNEPNNPEFWIDVHSANVGPNASEYAGFFRTVRDSIRLVDGKAEIAIGGLAGMDGQRRTFADPADEHREVMGLPSYEFLSRLIRTGLKYSPVAIHAYSSQPPGGKRTSSFPGLLVDSVAAVLKSAGVKPQLWVTEWGVQDRPLRTSGAIAEWFRDGLSELLCRDDVAMVAVYTLHDGDPRFRYGLLDGKGDTTEVGAGFASGLASARCSGTR